MVIETSAPVCKGLGHVHLDQIFAEMMGIASLNPSYKRKLRPGGDGSSAAIPIAAGAGLFYSV
jgi:hypothetical protein